MVPKHSVTEISRDQFRRLIKKLMQGEEVLRGPAPFARRGERMVIAMSHDGPLKSMAVVEAFRVPPVVVERDRPVLADEREVSVGAVVVLPPVMGLLEESIDERLDRLADGMRRSFDFFRDASVHRWRRSA